MYKGVETPPIIMNNVNVYLPGVIQIPSALEITAITNSYPMVVTTIEDPVTQENVYIPGQLVRLNIPFLYGMQQANQKTYKILSVSGNDLRLDVNSTNFDTFSVPLTGTKPASLAPAGANNLQFSNSTNQEAFQSLNNRGN